MKIENKSNTENHDASNPTKESRQDFSQDNILNDANGPFRPVNVKSHRLKKPHQTQQIKISEIFSQSREGIRMSLNNNQLLVDPTHSSIDLGFNYKSNQDTKNSDL